GRFNSVDPFEGFSEQPYSLHPFQYGYSDPVLMTDPAGTCAVTDDGEDCHRPQRNPRDLTGWLYREMKHNLEDPRLQSVKALNAIIFLSTTGVRIGPVVYVCILG